MYQTFATVRFIQNALGRPAKQDGLDLCILIFPIDWFLKVDSIKSHKLLNLYIDIKH